MSKKNIAISLFLMVIFFGALVIQYYMFSENISQILILSVVDFLIYSFAMMIFPAAIRIVNAKVLDNKYGKKICFLNSIVILIFSILINVILGTESYAGAGIIGALMFYFINMSFFVESNKVKKILYADNSNIPEAKEENYEKKIKNLKKEYSLIRNLFVVLMLIITIMGGYIFYREYTIKNEIENLEYGVTVLSDKITTYQEHLKETSDKLEFYDKNIVFVLQGYGNYYYTYDQVLLVTQGKEYSFWAYNIDAAIKKGYIPWNGNL